MADIPPIINYNPSNFLTGSRLTLHFNHGLVEVSERWGAHVIVVKAVAAGGSAEAPGDHDLAGEAGSAHVLREGRIAQTLNLLRLLKVLLFNN